MPKFNKPLNLNTVWASSALSDNKVYPGDSYTAQGWTQVKPPLEYENDINYRYGQFAAHVNQLGIVEWDSSTEYQAGKSYVQGSNNVIYKCIQTHINKNPSTAGNEAFWEVFEGNRQATTSNRGTTRYATNNQAFAGSANNVALTPSNLLSIFGTLSGNIDGGSVVLPISYQGSKRNLLIQTGTVVYNELAFSTPLNITFNIPYSVILHANALCFTAQGAGVILNGTNVTTQSLSIRLIEQDTSNAGGSVRWFAIGLQ